MQVGAHALDEEAPQLLDGRLGALVHRLVPFAALADDGVVLVTREEVGQLARVEEDVNELKEALRGEREGERGVGRGAEGCGVRVRGEGKGKK